MVGGMHRSGTSALAGALAAAGVNFGQNLIPAAEDNQKGFFEDADVVALNTNLLRKRFQDWDSCTPLEGATISAELFPAEFEQACGIVSSLAEGHRVCGLKDPRISLLTHFWTQVCHKVERQPLWLLCLRHPAEVAQSLYQRNRFSPIKSSALWLKYTLQLLEAQNGSPNVLPVEFAAARANPQSVLEHVGETLTLDADAADRFTGFFESNLAHGQKEGTDLKAGMIGELALTIYNAYLKGGVTSEALQQWRAAWRQLTPELAIIDSEYQRLEALTDRDREWVANLEERAAQFEAAQETIATLNAVAKQVPLLETRLADLEMLADQLRTKENELRASLGRERDLFEALQVAETERQHALSLAQSKQNEAWENHVALVDVLNSTSWKLSYPIRALKRLLMRLSGGAR